MKVLDRFISFIFSLAMLVLAIVVIMLVLDFTSINLVLDVINNYILNEEYYMIVLITAGLVIFAAIKTTIFLSDFKAKDKKPILVDSTNGIVEISQDTIDATVKTVANSFPEVRSVQARMVKQPKGIKVYTAITVLQDTNIKDLTESIQEKVKETIMNTTGITVLSTNIKVKNITQKLEKEERR